MTTTTTENKFKPGSKLSSSVSSGSVLIKSDLRTISGNVIFVDFEESLTKVTLRTPETSPEGVAIGGLTSIITSSNLPGSKLTEVFPKSNHEIMLPSNEILTISGVLPLLVKRTLNVPIVPAVTSPGSSLNLISTRRYTNG